MNRIPGIYTRLAAAVDFDPATMQATITLHFGAEDVAEFAGEIPGGIDRAVLAAALRNAAVTVEA